MPIAMILTLSAWEQKNISIPTLSSKWSVFWQENKGMHEQQFFFVFFAVYIRVAKNEHFLKKVRLWPSDDAYDVEKCHLPDLSQLRLLPPPPGNIHSIR